MYTSVHYEYTLRRDRSTIALSRVPLFASYVRACLSIESYSSFELVVFPVAGIGGMETTCLLNFEIGQSVDIV